ncbi:hypothetical protein FA15DRAFT_672950, partial [Coprinopsis marcescibilis]
MPFFQGASNCTIKDSTFQDVKGNLHNTFHQNFDSSGNLVSSSCHTHVFDPNGRSTTSSSFKYTPRSPPAAGRRRSSSLNSDRAPPDQGPATNQPGSGLHAATDEPGSGPRPSQTGSTVLNGGNFTSVNGRYYKDGRAIDETDPAFGTLFNQGGSGGTTVLNNVNMSAIGGRSHGHSRRPMGNTTENRKRRFLWGFIPRLQNSKSV